MTVTQGMREGRGNILKIVSVRLFFHFKVYVRPKLFLSGFFFMPLCHSGDLILLPVLQTQKEMQGNLSKMNGIPILKICTGTCVPIKGFSLKSQSDGNYKILYFTLTLYSMTMVTKTKR